MTFFGACESEQPRSAPLTSEDVCDGCGAQALTRVQMPSGNLLDFCGHDYRKHELALMAQGARVVHVIPVDGRKW